MNTTMLISHRLFAAAVHTDAEGRQRRSAARRTTIVDLDRTAGAPARTDVPVECLLRAGREVASASQRAFY